MSGRTDSAGTIRKAVYYADSFAYYALAGLLIAFVTSWWQYAFGCIFFTFAEYWVHRTLLHRFFYHGTHEDHHLRPSDYVVLWYTPLIFAGFYLVMPISVFAGFMLGYLWFIGWHHILHHVDLSEASRWVRRYAAWHDVHHKAVKFNFGITHPLWDVIFGTYRRP